MMDPCTDTVARRLAAQAADADTAADRAIYYAATAGVSFAAGVVFALLMVMP